MLAPAASDQHRRTAPAFGGRACPAAAISHNIAGWPLRPAAAGPPLRRIRSMPLITTIEDLRVLAKKRVPRMFYDYADSGSWTESTYRANESDLARIKLRQRVAVNLENRSTATQMLGVDVAMPVALAPTG